VRLIVAGDLVLAGADADAARRGELVALCRDVSERVREADLAVVNLEAPICDAGPAIRKLGPSLRIEPALAAAIGSFGFKAVNLANNHIMDHGPTGLGATLTACERLGMQTFGAGMGAAAAGQILVQEVGGLRIGLLGMAEHEFSLALHSSPGTNPADPIGFLAAVQRQAGSFDRLVVLVHGGIEHFPWPTPRLQRFCRFLAEHGAAAVICQHTHAIGCWEIYRGCPLVYGQGNFLFAAHTARESWWTGLLVELEFTAGKTGMNLLPCRSQPDRPGVSLLSGTEAQDVLAAMDERSTRLQEPGELDAEFRRYVETHDRWYLGLLEAFPRWLRKIDHRIPIFGLWRSPRRLAMQYNVVACESHREVLLHVLGRGAGLYQHGERENSRRC
jgi:poly-gamma-glutamate synthesis protein (capsule biosynthesis protein)